MCVSLRLKIHATFFVYKKLFEISFEGIIFDKNQVNTFLLDISWIHVEFWVTIHFYEYRILNSAFETEGINVFLF